MNMDRQLLDAARDGNLVLVELALRNGANVNGLDFFGWTPLHHACWRGHLDVVRCLLTTGHAILEVTDDDGMTPLHYACREGHVDVIRYLLTYHNANAEACTNNGYTPLHLACWSSKLDVVKELVQQKADISKG